VADVRLLDRAQAVQIFIDHYHSAPGIGGLPHGLQPTVFDGGASTNCPTPRTGVW